MDDKRTCYLCKYLEDDCIEPFLKLSMDVQVNLEELTLIGSVLAHLPQSVGKLTKLTSLTHCITDQQQGRPSHLVTKLVIAPEAAGELLVASFCMLAAGSVVDADACTVYR
jgi:hypothetical protein